MMFTSLERATTPWILYCTFTGVSGMEPQRKMNDGYTHMGKE